LPKPDRHFTDLPSALDVRAHEHMLRVEGAGFVTPSMIDEALAPFDGGNDLPPRILVDLRNVSGYEAACVESARRLLGRANAQGTERIAFVANSSVVRTATEVVARHLQAPLRTFNAAAQAEAWIRGNTPGSSHDSLPPVTCSEGPRAEPRRSAF